MGLMPHPEHAVDPLLGSADGGAPARGSRRRRGSARAGRRLARRRGALASSRRSRSRQPGAPPEHGRALERRPQSLDVARPHRGTASRRSPGRVGEAHEALAGPRLEQLDDDGEALLPRAAGRTLLDDGRRAPGVAAVDPLRPSSPWSRAYGCPSHGWGTLAPTSCRLVVPAGRMLATCTTWSSSVRAPPAACSRRALPGPGPPRCSHRGRPSRAQARVQDPGRVLEALPDEPRLGRLHRSAGRARRSRDRVPARAHGGRLDRDERDMVLRGHPADYEAWATVGCPGWA